MNTLYRISIFSLSCLLLLIIATVLMPKKSAMAETNANCENFSVGGPFFDNYERAEYIDGLLRLHLRIKEGVDTTQEWRLDFRIYDENCKFSNYGFLGDISLRPSTRYFSFRWMSKSTAESRMEVWDDESNTPEPCPKCRIGISGPSVYHPFALIGSLTDSSGSYFLSTSFPRAELPPDPVIIIPGILGSWTKNGKLVIDPVLHTYDDLIETLEANSYKLNTTLFPFPYEWRNSNILSAKDLRDKINEVQAICKCAKVDLVAHSMGGLVARQYIQSSDYEGDVDQLIFLGTPHLGGPKAYLTWEAGEFGKKTSDNLTKFIFKTEGKKAGYKDLFDYVRNRPITSVKELLPTYYYLKDNDTGLTRTYPNNYPVNQFLDDLNQNIDRLITSDIRITNIFGELGLDSTVNTIRVIHPSSKLPLWEHGYPDGFSAFFGDHGLEMGSGDETVPWLSSQFIKEDQHEFLSEHGALVSDASALIYKKLTNKNAGTIIKKDRSLGPNRRMLIAKMLSPADFVITAPDGKRIGKDFTTDQEINEIPDAFYSGFLTDDEYLTIPNPLDGEYKVKSQGTGNGGEYTIAVGYITDTTSDDQDYTATITTGAMQELGVIINAASADDPLELKPSDVTPPAMAITSPIAKDYLRSEKIAINVAVSDTESGVASQKILLDGKEMQSGTSADLFFAPLGNHTLVMTAIDNAGNPASTSVAFRTIATLAGMIQDVDRLNALKSFSNLRTYAYLRMQLSATLVIAIGKNWKLNFTNSFVKTLNQFYKNKQLTKQAYDILKEDANWLLTH